MATPHISKTPISIPLPDGSYCALYNDVILSHVTRYYQDPEATNDLFATLDASTSENLNYRGLVYQIYQDNFVYNPNLALPVPYLSEDSVEEEVESDGDIPSDPQVQKDTYFVSTPIFECISPTATYANQKGIANVLFWTNLIAGNTFKVTQGGQDKYKYDPSKILKIKKDEMSSFVFEDNTITRVLCSVTIEFKQLYVKNSIAGSEESLSKRLIPVASDINILREEQADFPVLDFTINGNGRTASHSRHAHTNNSDCGFAFAVFHPGTGVPLGNPWRR